MPSTQGLRPFEAFILWGKCGLLFFSHQSTQFAAPQVTGEPDTSTEGKEHGKRDDFTMAEAQASEIWGGGQQRGKMGAFLS